MIHARVKSKRPPWMSKHSRILWICVSILLIIIFTHLFTLQNIKSEPLNTEPNLIIDNNITPLFMEKQSQNINPNIETNTANGITLLFVAGIEGTGHHLWLNITTTMSESYPNDVSVLFYHGAEPYKFSPQLRDCFCKDMQQTNGHSGHCLQVIAKLKQIYFNKYKRILDANPNKNILMHLRSFSYPFLSLDLKHIPNIIKLKTLIHIVNKELNKNIFNIKFIVLKREWVSALVSCCIHRYGRCNQRVSLLPKALHALNQQLMNISNNDWFMLNYDDFVSRPLEYKYIIANWLNIDNINIVETGLSKIDNKKGSKSATEKAWNMLSQKMSPRSDNGVIAPQKLNGLKAKVMHNFYSDDAKENAPLFYKECLVVTPENTACDVR